jgi:transcriptional regulator with XRE-family HTH domain
MDATLPNGHFASQAKIAHEPMDRRILWRDASIMPARKPPRPAPEFLRKWRLYRDLTLEQVGNIVGVGPQAVHKWETGKSPVELETLKLLAQVYGTSPAGLLFDPEDPAISEQVRQAVELMKRLPAETRDLWIASGRAMAPKAPPKK